MIFQQGFYACYTYNSYLYEPINRVKAKIVEQQ